jgi:Protein of unknown function (DUF1573)
MRSIIIIVSAISLTIGLQGCEQQNKDTQQLDPAIVNNPATSNPDAAAGKDLLPILEFETTRHHFGVIQSGEKVSYSFGFKNTGNAPLVITNAKASCGCTIPSYTKKPIQPGADGSIEVTFDSKGKSGMESKNITIVANTIPNSTILTISAEIVKSEE